MTEQASSPSKHDQSTLDRLLTEMCRYCDQDCRPGEAASQLKANLKDAILTKFPNLRHETPQ